MGPPIEGLRFAYTFRAVDAWVMMSKFAVARPLMNDNSGVKPVSTLALDIGTSSVRAGVYGADGYEISGTAVNLESEFHATSDGSAEYDANEAISRSRVWLTLSLIGLQLSRLK